MDRPKRAIKATVRLIAEDDEPGKKEAKSVNKKMHLNNQQNNVECRKELQQKLQAHPLKQRRQSEEL